MFYIFSCWSYHGNWQIFQFNNAVSDPSVCTSRENNNDNNYTNKTRKRGSMSIWTKLGSRRISV